MTQSLLPVVREGTYDSVAQSLEEQYSSDKEMVLNSLEHLNDVNPNIRKFIVHWTKDLTGKRFIHTLVGLCALYRLLESESEAGLFEKEMEESNG